MGILDFFQQTNSPYPEDMRYKAGMQSLGLLGGTMMAAGAPSTDPGQYGKIMAQGLAQAGPMMQQSLDQQMQMQDMMAEREREAAMQAYMESPEFGAGMSPEQMEFIRNAPPEVGMGLLGDSLFAQEPPRLQSGMVWNPETQTFDPVQSYWDNKARLAEVGRAQNTTNITTNMAGDGIDYGAPPTDTTWARGPDGNIILQEDPSTGYKTPVAVPIPGGPLWQDQQDAAAAAEAAADKAETTENTENIQYMVVQDDVGRALELAQNEKAVGFIGARSADIEGTPAYNLRQTLLSLEANIAFDALNQMRAASATGGALGNVTERELALLAATYGSIDPNQSGSILQYNLKRLEWAMDKVVNGVPLDPTNPSAGTRKVTQADFDAFTATLGGGDSPPVAAPDKTDEELMRSLGIQ